MLFFRRRDTLTRSNLTDQERCIHACLFFAFISLTLTIVLFYFGTTTKAMDEPRLYYYIGAGVCLAFFVLITICTIYYVRRFYGSSLSSNNHRSAALESEGDSSKYSTHDP